MRKSERERREKERERERGRERDLAYPYLDRLSSGGTEPVPVRTEDQSINDLSSIQSVQMLPLIQIPQHSIAILQVCVCACVSESGLQVV